MQKFLRMGKNYERIQNSGKHTRKRIGNLLGPFFLMTEANTIRAIDSFVYTMTSWNMASQSNF